MKFFIVLALAIIGATAAPPVQEDSGIVERVTEIINSILDIIPEPLLDIHGDEASLDLGIEQLNFTFDNIVLSGIKNLEITTLTYDEDTGRLDYVLTTPEIKSTVEFDLVLSGLLDAVNHPVVQVDLTDFALTGYAVIDTTVTPTKVTDFSVLNVLGGATVELSGILNDDALSEKLETLLNEQLVSATNEVNVQLEPIVSPIVKSAINLIISLLN